MVTERKSKRAKSHQEAIVPSETVRFSLTSSGFMILALTRQIGKEADMLDLFITAGEYVERVRLEQNGPDVDRIRPKSIAGLEEEQRVRALQKTEEVEQRRKLLHYRYL